ncbi:O-antigen ligase family protein [Vibrio scophthalmi]|nr:O-antigen ligase family protein [Vibrio scophthalmi]
MAVIPVCFFVGWFFRERFQVNKSSVRQCVFEKMLIVFIVYSGVSFFWSDYPDASIKMFLAMCVLSFIYFFLRNIVVNLSLDGLVKVLIISGLVINLVSLLLYIFSFLSLDGNFNSMPKGTYMGLLVDRGVPRLTGLLNDPNLFVVMNLIFVFVSFSFRQFKMSKMLMVVSLCSVFLTFSRGGWVAIFIGLVCVFVFSMFKDSKPINFIKLALVVLTFVLMMVVFYQFIPEQYKVYFVERFAHIGSASGRFKLWNNAVSLLPQSGLFGFGIFSAKHVNCDMFMSCKYFHNTYLALLLEVGVLGFALYYLPHVYLLIKTIKVMLFNLNENVVRFSSFLFGVHVSILAMMMSLTIYANEILIILFSLHVLLHSVYQREAFGEVKR